MRESNTRALKQPKVFYLSCLTTLCERFGFYAISFLLVIYAKAIFQYSDTESFALFAIFNALVYLTPAIGGYLADNFIGIRRCIILGLVLECVGLALLASTAELIFLLGLALVTIGVGLFKTGPTDLMARAYGEHDPRIDSGFTLFYMSINIGVLLASVVFGFVLKFFGWHWTFIAASSTLILSLLAYFVLRESAAKDDSDPGKVKLRLNLKFLFPVGIILAAIIFTTMLYYLNIANIFFIVTTVLVALYFLFEIIRSSMEEKLKIIACLFLILVGFVFFVMYFQYYESMVLFIKRSVGHEIFGFTFPITVFLSFNAVWIIVLSPVLAWLYKYLGKRDKDLAVTTKFPLGVLITSLCFFTLVASQYFLNPEMRISPLWVFFAMFFYSLGELLVSALGVAMVAHIAPERMYGVMMGAWFLMGMAMASSVSGRVAAWASVPASITDPLQIFHIYMHAFLRIGLIGLVCAVVIFIFSPFIKRIANL
jgi:POT family proton-dependent oligopeptide transporter